MNEDVYLYRSEVVAAYIAALANERRYNINMTKMQKLLYAAYGACLALYDERLTNEHPQAWPYGPVFPISRKKLLNVDLFDIDKSESRFDEIRDDKKVNGLLELVMRSYGKFNATSLVEWSHKEGSPWDKTTKEPDFKWGDNMSDMDIQSYFNTLMVYKNENAH
jgi:uncharacterized phage-associated protein